jgi:hypothetical protein
MMITISLRNDSAQKFNQHSVEIWMYIQKKIFIFIENFFWYSLIILSHESS